MTYLLNPYSSNKQGFYRLHGKRVLDLLLASLLLVALSPVLCVVAVLVRIAMGSPILFQQKRPGLHGRPFMLRKFRTMSNAVDSSNTLLPSDQRLVPFGRVLRSTSLDELPELWNVIKGEMSLVGPRPLLVDYLSIYTPEQARRHDVLPGLTGWSQVNGRNAVTWEERFKGDVWYVDNQSFWLDLKILFLTIGMVLRRKNITPNDSGKMPRFTGQPASKTDS